MDIQLPEMLTPAMDAYLKTWRPRICRADTHVGLWASAKGVPMSGEAIYDRVRKHTREAFDHPINPADHASQTLVPRHEWKTFHAALKECSVPMDRIGYGDFGADAGEINFPKKSGGGRAIRHLRYTLKNDTLVIRGAKIGQDADVMVDVFERVLKSGHYAGQTFSYADDEIWRRAKRLDSCGNSSMWREWNMAHHLARVVRDLGAIAGVKFEEGHKSTLPAKELQLFEPELLD